MKTLCVATACLAMTACLTRDESGGETRADAAANRLLLRVERADTAPDGQRCLLAVTARNDTGHAALNVQVAWMAQTEGSGSISDYQVLGDFAAGEAREVQLGIFGAPCDAVREVTLSRAVCTVGPAQVPPQSCADLVVLDAARAGAK